MFVTSQFTNQIMRFEVPSWAVFDVTLDSPSKCPSALTFPLPMARHRPATTCHVRHADFCTRPDGADDSRPDARRRGLRRQRDVTRQPVEPRGGVIADGQGVGTIIDNDDCTKFYVVNDATPNRTYEYDATGVLVESYNIDQRQHGPARRGQHGGRRQGLGRRRQPQGLCLRHQRRLCSAPGPPARCPAMPRSRRHRHQRHRRLDRRCQERQGLSLRRRGQPPLRQPERRQQLQPQQRQHEPQGHRHRRHASVGRQRRHDRQGLQVHDRRPLRRKLDDRWRRHDPDGHHASTRPTSATSGSSTAAPTASISTPAPPAAPPAASPPPPPSPWPPATPTPKASPIRL